MNDINKLSKNNTGTGDIRLRIRVTANKSFPLFDRIITNGGFVSVDWGDGNTETLTDMTTYSPKHTYAKAGEYIVKLTGSKFTVVEGVGSSISYSDFQVAVKEILSLKMPTDSTEVSLAYAFYGCDNLTGSIPEWDDCIADASHTYEGCTGLTGSIPKWGANITDAYATYMDCTGLTGNIPEWGSNITAADSTYYRCTGLTGGIPAWGPNITSAFNTYSDCRGLTGNIPEWGSKITNANSTYDGCVHLTGSVPEWGTKIISAYQTYRDCFGLTGRIPEWSMNITSAGYTYHNCSGLTGCSEELLQDPMPSTIAQYADCVYGCVDEIRQHFTKDWGGTKAKLTESRKKFKDVYKALLERKISH